MLNHTKWEICQNQVTRILEKSKRKQGRFLILKNKKAQSSSRSLSIYKMHRV